MRPFYVFLRTHTVLDVCGVFDVSFICWSKFGRSGYCPGLPGDLVSGPWGSIPGPGRGGSEGSGGAGPHKNVYFYSRPDGRHHTGISVGTEWYTTRVV